MDLPRTRDVDYWAWDKEMEEAATAFKEKKINSTDFYGLIARIQKKYVGRVFNEDIHKFSDEIKLRIFLRQVESDSARIESIVIHEREHFEVAQQVGAQPVYGVARFFIREFNGNRYAMYHPFVESKPQNPGDLVKIVSAPARLSDHDIRILR